MEPVDAISPHPWGVSTQKGDKVYLHILDYKDPSLLIPSFGSKIKSAKVFGDNDKKLALIYTKEGTVLKLPAVRSNDYDLIIELDI